MVDYSKWNNIEISDDEDDTHPNVDTGSLFRWRHQARVERMAEAKKEVDELNKKKTEQQQKLTDIKKKLKETDSFGATDLSQLKVELTELEKQEAEFQKKEKELDEKEKKTPWNVDTLSKDGYSKTVINKAKPKKDEALTEEEREARQLKFVKENKKLVEKYGMLQKYDDSKKFLMENPHLTCEETANYLVVWCINLVLDEKTDLMEHVAHQTICMQYILELARQMDIDPRSCISSFFTKIQIAEKEYVDSFHDEIRSFKQRIKDRAKQKLDIALEEAETEEREKRLGPGGLDPVEVFESLPVELQKCFESQDIPLLQETISKMPEEEARYHMKRCVESGLWVPERSSKEEESEASNLSEQQEDNSESKKDK